MQSKQQLPFPDRPVVNIVETEVFFNRKPKSTRPCYHTPDYDVNMLSMLYPANATSGHGPSAIKKKNAHRLVVREVIISLDGNDSCYRLVVREVIISLDGNDSCRCVPLR